ncbi:MAG: hypothetical protein KGP28_01845 [Bdellovibrionales bacterium]|nr:hypothetical protein [Bdellovibrionales bacterium]
MATLFPFFLLLIGLAPKNSFGAGSGCVEFLKPEIRNPEIRNPGLDGELNATITSLSNRYSRIYPELGLSGMDLKLRKLTTRALVAIDLKSDGRELNPSHLRELINLFLRFKGQASLENLSASYIGNLARGNMEEAKREASILLAHLRPVEFEKAPELFGLHPEESPIWGTLAKEHPAVFERIRITDMGGKDHELIVLLGHPENATSTVQRFHQILRSRYGSELYINDDLVPSALGFYQRVEGEGKDGLSYIILRTENLKSDFLDFVGFHEGRHVMFKSARTRLKSVAAVEVQIRAEAGKELPAWYSKELNVPTPENQTARSIHAENNVYRKFMTFEENYNHVKDLQYANRMKHQTVLDLFERNETLPPHRIFDLELIKDKITLLDEITAKTKISALDARLLIERQAKQLSSEISSFPATIPMLEGLNREFLEFKVTDGYSMKIDFSTSSEMQMAEALLQKYRNFQSSRTPGGNASGESVSRAEKELLEEFGRFQEALSERLIESYDFALEIKIQLAALSDLYHLVSGKPGITKDEYIRFRGEIFRQGRHAKTMLFREGNPEDASNLSGP